MDMNFFKEQKIRQIEWWKRHSNYADWEEQPGKWGKQNEWDYPQISFFWELVNPFGMNG